MSIGSGPPSPSADEGTRVYVLSGAGLSKASGVPTFRDHDGLWKGRRFEEVAAPEAWARNAEMVRTFYDERRLACAAVLPNRAHEALARLQHALGARRCTLVTQNIDGLLHKAGAADVVEMHGSLWRLRCSGDVDHPRTGVFGPQSRTATCALCGELMRPDVVWFGEMPYAMARIEAEVRACDIFLSVGTSGVVYPAAGLVRVARAAGAQCIEVNPEPSDGPFHDVIAEGAEFAVPRLVGRWLQEDRTPAPR